MADESLIEEMRATLRGDRERAEQRRSVDEPAAWALKDAPPPQEGLPADETRRPESEAKPVAAHGRIGWLARLRRRRNS
jgi:hypothetical protein